MTFFTHLSRPIVPVIRKRKKIVKKMSGTDIVKLDHTLAIWTFTFHKIQAVLR